MPGDGVITGIAPIGCIGAPLCFGPDADVVAACTVTAPGGRDLTASYQRYYAHKKEVFKRPMRFEPAPRKSIAKRRGLKELIRNA